MSGKGGLGRGLGGGKLGSAGKGIGALIPGAPNRAAPFEVSRSLIEPDPDQPRKRFDEEALAELARSIKANGLIQPIVVRAMEGGRYQIIAGERRWRASGLAELELVPIVCREVSSEEAFELAILENIQREDLSPIEEALSFVKLMEDRGYTQEVLAERTGKSRAAISNAIRLLKLSTELQALIEEGTLTAGHARALLMLKEEGQREALATKIASEGWSVRRSEEWARRVKEAGSTSGAQPKPKPSQGQEEASGSLSATLTTLQEGGAAREAQLMELEESLKGSLKRSVSVKSKRGGGGQLVLSFKGDEDLIRLAELLLRP